MGTKRTTAGIKLRRIIKLFRGFLLAFLLKQNRIFFNEKTFVPFLSLLILEGFVLSHFFPFFVCLKVELASVTSITNFTYRPPKPKNKKSWETFLVSMLEIIKANIKFMLYIFIFMHNIIKIWPILNRRSVEAFASSRKPKENQILLKNYLASLNWIFVVSLKIPETLNFERHCKSKNETA